MQEGFVLFIGSMGIAAAVFFLVMALVSRSADPLHARMEGLRTRTRPRDASDLSRPFSDRVLGPILDSLADRVFALLPGNMRGTLHQKLVTAGDPLSVGAFVAVMAGAAALLALLGGLMGIALTGGFQATTLLLGIALAPAGAALPYLWLNNAVRSRQSAVLLSLPDSFDLITTCVEAGLGLDAALARVAEKVQGPFAEELAQTLREVGLGRMRREALLDLGERTSVPELMSFINAVIQAEQMGASIGQVLRVQSDQMRLKRRQRAEQKAYQAPVKMVFPLVLCIFPTLFIVILGPAGISVYENFINK